MFQPKVADMFELELENQIFNTLDNFYWTVKFAIKFRIEKIFTLKFENLKV